MKALFVAEVVKGYHVIKKKISCNTVEFENL